MPQYKSHTEERLILSKEEKSSFSYLSRYLESPIWILKEDGTCLLYTSEFQLFFIGKRLNLAATAGAVKLARWSHTVLRWL